MKKFHNCLIKCISSNCFLLATFLVSIIIMFMCKISCLQIPVSCSKNVIQGVNESLFSIAGSYIAGYIFYILTVYIPTQYRRKQMLVIFHEYVKNTKGQMDDISNVICGTFEMFKVSSVQLASYLVEENTPDDYRMKKENGNYLLSMVNYAVSYLDYPISQIGYFSDKEVIIIHEILRQELCIKTKLEDKMDNQSLFLLWGKTEIEEFAQDVLNLYSQIENLYKSTNSNGNN